MAILRSYAAPGTSRAIPEAVPAQSDSTVSPAVAYDTAGLEFSYSTNPALENSINTTFRDLLGRDATQEELTKYGQTGTFVNNAESIYKDYANEIPQDKKAPEADQGTSAFYNPSGYWAEAYAKNKSGYDDYWAGVSGDTQWHADADAAKFNNQDVAEFLTKTAPDQTTALFKDAGIDEVRAGDYATWIASQDWGGISSYELQKKLGLSDEQIGSIGRAMFSDRDLNTSGNRGGGREQTEGNRPATPGDADRNNQDYKQFTAYDSEKGLHFTGGYVPEKKQVDWMGNIVLGVLLGGVGFAAGAAIGAGAAAAGAGGTASTVGASGSVVAGTGAAGAIGATGGGAVAGGVGAAIQGGDVGNGVLTGAVTGGLGQIGSPSMTGIRTVDSAISGAARGAIGASVSGGDATVGAVSGATSSVINPIVRQYVPGVAGSLVNGLVNAAVKSSLVDDPSSTRQPIAYQEQETTTGMIGALPSTTSKRVIRR